jgi:uncharacterized delta-60 repeat protein
VVLAVPLAQPARATASGGLDPDFGGGGTVSTSLGGMQAAYGLAVQNDGRIVAAGYANLNGNYDFALARYTSRGTLDPTFGASGVVLTDIGGSGSYDVGRGMALQPDGKIVVAGQSSAGPGMALTRYDQDGRLDSGFGIGGKVITTIPGIAYAVALQPDGKIIVTGSADSRSGNDIAVARFRSDGALDAGFGAAGVTLTDVSTASSDNAGAALALQPDGAIVVAGHSQNSNGTVFTVLRYRSDGMLDPAFGTAGAAVTSVGGTSHTSAATTVEVAPDGTIVAAGSTQAPDGSSEFALARYGPNGDLDTSFGDAGTTTTQVGGSGSYAHAAALAFDHSGRLVVTGSAGRLRDASFALVRYDASGNVDVSFGDHGIVMTKCGGADDRAFDLAVQADGKEVVAGYSGVNFALARYLP